MQKVKHLFFFCFLLLAAGALRAQSPADFDQANRLYDQGKLDEAARCYQSLVDARKYSAALFYNLGNTEYRRNHPGPAILDYERALALEPAHQEARANLAFVRSKTGAITGPLSWTDRLFPQVNANSFTLLTAIAGWIAVFCFVLSRSRNRKDGLILPGMALLALFVCAYGAGGALHSARDRSLAIVTADQARAHYAPADNSTLAETLPVGSRVRIVRDRGAWFYCILPNGNLAWIPSKSVEPVRLPSS